MIGDIRAAPVRRRPIAGAALPLALRPGRGSAPHRALGPGLVLCLALSGCATTSFYGTGGAQQPSPVPSEIGIAQLGVGDCFGEFDRDALTSALTVVDCDDVHVYEVFHLFELLEGDYPGADEIDDAAYTECDPAFASFIGVPSRYSQLSYFYFAPTEDSWTDDDDRGVACVVGASGITVAGSLRGYRR